MIRAEELIVGGGVRGIVRSENFVAGTSGWAWFGNGTFEAQSGIFRGTLNGADIIAGTIQVDKLVIGSMDNLVTNPGFEADVIEGTLDPHVYGDGSGGVWTSAVTARSGGRAARYDIDSQSSTAALTSNGLFATATAHPAAAEGDEFYFEFFARGTGSGTLPTVDARLVWLDEDEAAITPTDGTNVLTTTSYQNVFVSGTAPAGVASVAFQCRVLTGASSTAAVLFDDLYARRMIGTLIIEGQAVDIARMLNPVHADGGNANSQNDTVNTTLTEEVQVTLTIPSWVGVSNSLLVGGLQMTDSTERLITLRPRIAGTLGSAVDQEISNADISETVAFSVQQHRQITSPGSTIKFSLESKVSTGSNALNQHEISVLSTGIR